MKKITLYLLILFLSMSSLTNAQSARVQVIHNSADLAAATVDLYIDDIKFIDNFEFRTASSFVSLGAEVPVKIDIAPSNSMSSAETIYTLNTALTDGATYILIASGNISDSGYTVTENFSIEVFNMAKEVADNASEIDLLVHHGVTDAPQVDINILAPPVKLVNDIGYSDFNGYSPVASGDYNLEVTTADETVSVGQFIAPLRNLGMDGEAVTILASGFLNPSANSNGPSFGLWAARPSGGALIQFPPPTATVQLIHNSADLSIETVDVYVNDELIVDDFEFRTATPFVEISANIDLRVQIAPSNSGSSADAFFQLDTILERNKIYLFVANGIDSSSGYTQPNTFGISVYDQAGVNAPNPNEINLLVHHGGTDAPTIDIDVTAPPFKLTDDISYGEFGDYVPVISGDYTLNVTTEDETTVLGQFVAPLRFLNLEGKAMTVVANGFLDPTQNSNGPSFGLWGVLPEGGNLIEFTPTTAEVQVIHNSADLTASVVDVYLDNQLLIDDFAFRTATPFVEIPAGRDISIEIAPSNSSSVDDAIFEFNTALVKNETYILVADGNISSSGYTQTENFSIEVFSGAQKVASTGSRTAMLVHHGSTDAPTVDVREAIAMLVLVNDISYPEFDTYFELPTSDYFIDVTTSDGSVIVETYLAELSTLGLDGEAITIVASGFLDPSQNSNGPAFGLWVATQTGGNLVELPIATLSSNQFESLGLQVYPNPVENELFIDMINPIETAISVFDLSGRNVLTTEISGLNNSISTTTLNSGIYLLSISNAQGKGTLKFVKK